MTPKCLKYGLWVATAVKSSAIFYLNFHKRAVRSQAWVLSLVVIRFMRRLTAEFEMLSNILLFLFLWLILHSVLCFFYITEPKSTNNKKAVLYHVNKNTPKHCWIFVLFVKTDGQHFKSPQNPVHVSSACIFFECVCVCKIRWRTKVSVSYCSPACMSISGACRAWALPSRCCCGMIGGGWGKAWLIWPYAAG